MTTNDEWTFVPPRRKNKGGTAGALDPSHMHDNRPPPIDHTMSLEKLRADYKLRLRVWRQSEARVSLLKILRFLQPDEGWGIRKAVLIGTGSFNREGDSIEHKRLSQLAVFVDLVGHLDSQRAEAQDTAPGEDCKKIRMFAQEPHYTELDTGFLKELGLEIVTFGEEDLRRETGLGPATELFGKDTFVCEFFIFFQGLTTRPFVQGGSRLMISTVRRRLMDEAFFKPTFGHMVVGILEELDSKYRNYHFPPFPEGGRSNWELLDIFGPLPQEDEGSTAAKELSGKDQPT